MNNCDCFVGFLCGEQVTKFSIDNEVEGIESHQLLSKQYGFLNGEPHTKRQIVDSQNEYLERFDYCPYCGEKIDWKQVLSNL